MVREEKSCEHVWFHLTAHEMWLTQTNYGDLVKLRRFGETRLETRVVHRMMMRLSGRTHFLKQPDV